MRTALGIRMHSGWGIVVVVRGAEVLDRRKIITCDTRQPGAKQPYHYAADLDLAAAEKHLRECAETSERLATGAIAEVVWDYSVTTAAIVTGSGRALPALPKILASHALIHTAEGEFFRDSVRRACERLKLRVASVSERELDPSREIVRRPAGPPWTKDHKLAALAASLLMSREAAGSERGERHGDRSHHADVYSQ